MAREPTPLEKLNRDHNWHQGSLRRLLANVSIITDYHDRQEATSIIHREILRVKAKFEKEKAQLQ